MTAARLEIIADGVRKMDQPMICYDQFQRFATDVLQNSSQEGTTSGLRALARTVSVTKGAAAKIDMRQDQLVFINKGATKLVAHASAGREQVVAFHFAGDLVSIPANDGLEYSLWALSDAQLLAFPTLEFLRIVNQDAGILANVLERTMTALHRCREKALALGRKTARERVAGFLTSMAERIGNADDDGCRIDLPMSRRDIGDSLGLTIETVSRQFSEMRLAGLVETSGRSSVRLVDSAALADRAGQLSATS
jgi:CRP-like cAMP-binding protein